MNDEAEFVVTLPESLEPEVTHVARARTTLGVLVQMIAQAKDEIILGAPYMSGTNVLSQGVLQAALQYAVENRSVTLSIVTTGQSLSTFDNISWISNNPTTVRFYQPKANLQPEQYLGSHAKFCIVDRKEAYIGSANFTFLGLHQHLEMGILTKGKLAKQVSDFWRSLIVNEFFIPV